MPSPAAASGLNDAAILLFVIDGGCAAIAEARAILARHEQAAQAASVRRDPSHLQAAAPLAARLSAGPDQMARPCCGRPVQQCACAQPCSAT
jgi:hypothetical protein